MGFFNPKKRAEEVMMGLIKNIKLTNLFLWLRFFLSFLFSLSLVLQNIDYFPPSNLDSTSDLESFTSYLDIRIPGFMETYSVPGTALAIIKDGKLVWKNAYGYSDLNSGIELTSDTHMRVQSISKSVTAWGVMRLVEKGKLDLDRPVKDYLQEWQMPKNKYSIDTVSVRQLLTHTAGFPIGDFFNYYSPDEKIPSLKESLSKELFLFQEPGSSFSYSNTGYNLLELLIEEITGMKFADYMDQEILLPLGMDHSSFVWNQQWDPPVPNGYTLEGKNVPVYIYPEKASGGLFSTTEDIAKFLIASMPQYSTKNVLSNQSINLMHTPYVKQIGIYNLVFEGYGFGHYIETLQNGMKTISHGGQGTGWMTHYHAFPETGDGIVILTNSQRSWPMISYLLLDWSRWIGTPPPGMNRIIQGNSFLWLIIFILWFFVFWLIGKFLNLLFTQNHFKGYFNKPSQPFQYIRIIISLIILSGLLWSIQQKYLFISSVFPIAASWLAISLLAFALILLCSVFISNSKEL